MIIGKLQPNDAPIFLWRPDLVKGTPIFLLILALACEIPKNLFQENPPLFILPSSKQNAFLRPTGRSGASGFLGPVPGGYLQDFRTFLSDQLIQAHARPPN